MRHTMKGFAVALTSLLALLLVAPTASAAEQEGRVDIPRFVDETRASGIDHVYDGDFQFYVGGGVAVFDCDDDGLAELYFAGGSNLAELYHNDSDVGGSLRFSPVFDPATDLGSVLGAYPLDIDGDGLTDLAVLRNGENVLLRGLGACRFERANEAWGFDGGDEWTTAFSAKWEPGAALPTLAIGDYISDESDATAWRCSTSELVRPAADAMAYGPPTPLTPGWCPLSMLFSDWDRSGRVDLRVSNDRSYYPHAEGQDQLWRVAPGEAPRPYTADDGWQRLQLWGMGVASHDVTGDGYPDFFLSSMGPNRLQTLADGPDQPVFTDISIDRGVTAVNPAGDKSLPSTAWHDEFADVNNDGLIDLYLAKGNVNEMADHAMDDPSVLFLGQPDGSFIDEAAAAGIQSPERGRGAALVDLNLDGMLDVVQSNRRDEVGIWRNVGSGKARHPAQLGDWLALRLDQPGPNRDGIGAWVEVRAGGRSMTQEVTVGGGHAGGQLGWIHFGLGPSGETVAAEVRVQWPDQEWGPWLDVDPNQFLSIERDAPAALAWKPAVAAGSDRVVAAADECVRSADRSKSVARLWDEALLDAIRRDFPAPTVHARNLFHASAAMWDAWAVYDPDAAGVFVNEKIELDDPTSARRKAISYAAYRVLSHRYRDAQGGKRSLRQFDELMASLCYPIDRTHVNGESPAAVGNRIAARVIADGLRDGSRERQGYTSRDYAPVNEPMIVRVPGTEMVDPNRWQPLALDVAYTQNGQLLPVGLQEFIGPHWGEVDAFALPATSAPGLPIDPGAPPLLHDQYSDAEFKDSAVEVVRFSSLLDPRDGHVQDISPRMLGGNTLGSNDGSGYAVNPVTGEPYDRNIVPRADFGRVLAEFWADGPESETPPGHWNTLANTVTDTPGFERRIGGVGDELDPLEWDVKLYLALNGAAHDAAVAAWGAKGHYDYVRPISMIRWMGGLGQSSHPGGPAYHPDGLPLVDGEVEVISEASAAPGQRHEHLAEYIGEIAIRAWAGNPDDETELGGVGWIRAVGWVPYQLSTFVTPSFAGYVSGHSTFSRAAAEVLSAITGSEYFPGGLGTWTIPAGSLEFESGPGEDVELQWATYYDAADQAGISRLYGGIHVEVDDLNGRVMGAQCGRDAWATAQRYWDGSARA